MLARRGCGHCVWHSISYPHVLISQWFSQGSGEFVSHSQPTPHFCLTLTELSSLLRTDIYVLPTSCIFLVMKLATSPDQSNAAFFMSSSSHHITKSPLCFLSLYSLLTPLHQSWWGHLFVDFHACILLFQGTLRPTHSFTSLRAVWGSKHWFVILPLPSPSTAFPFSLRWSFTMWPKLASNSPCSMGWPFSHDGPPCWDYRYSPLPLAESLVS